MTKSRKTLLAAVFLLTTGSATAEENFPNLPPAAEVARSLAEAPAIRAASAQREAEIANRIRLEAGQHEWNFRVGSQHRRSRPQSLPSERTTDWSTALERPLRMPGKAALDANLGALGVSMADTALGDARHEIGRLLLKSWFAWLREATAFSQWGAQVKLLDQQASTVRRRWQLGDAARIETIQADAALAQAHAQLAQAGSREQTAAETLRRIFPGIQPANNAPLAEPRAFAGDAETWIEAALSHSHELGLARAETQRASLLAERAHRERLPDPTLGLALSRERSGEESVFGVYISIPLPGSARTAAADAASAQHVATQFNEAGVRQKISAETAALFQAAKAAVPAWEASRSAANHLDESARLTARAFQLGEGSLSDLLISRRLANEAELAALTLQLDALELYCRLLLDTHQLWDFD